MDSDHENAIPVGRASVHIPGRPHKSTVWRWVLCGVRGIKLGSFVVGTMRFTTPALIERFIAETTAKANGQPAPTRTPKQRERAIAAAERILQEAGI